MTVAVALLRGINVGGKNSLPMADLRAMCERLGLRDVATYIQSGNVVFVCDARRLAGVAGSIADAVEASRGFRPGVATRTLDDLRGVVAANPFAGGRGEPINGTRLLVMFLERAPSPAAARTLGALARGPERLVLAGREVYLHFPNGVAESAVSLATIEKATGVAGTTRNWNTVTKLVEMGEMAAGPPATSPKTSARRCRNPSPD